MLDKLLYLCYDYYIMKGENKMENVLQETKQEITDWMESEDEETIDRDNFDSFSEFRLALIKRDGLRVGENYSDNSGNYRIISSIDGKVCVLRLTDQREEILDAESLLAKTIEKYLNNIVQDNQKIQKKRQTVPQARVSRAPNPNPKFQENYDNFPENEQQAMTLGWLSRYGRIRVDIPPKDVSKFNTEYYNIKGVFPNETPDSYYVYPENNKSRSFSLRLWFRWLPDFDLADCNVYENTEQGISNNEFIKRLLCLGFDLGDSQNYEEILERIPEQHKIAFSRGAQMGRN
jgi:hypothetical protein